MGKKVPGTERAAAVPHWELYADLSYYLLLGRLPTRLPGDDCRLLEGLPQEGKNRLLERLLGAVFAVRPNYNQPLDQLGEASKRLVLNR